MLTLLQGLPKRLWRKHSWSIHNMEDIMQEDICPWQSPMDMYVYIYIYIYIMCTVYIYIYVYNCIYILNGGSSFCFLKSTPRTQKTINRSVVGYLFATSWFDCSSFHSIVVNVQFMQILLKLGVRTSDCSLKIMLRKCRFCSCLQVICANLIWRHQFLRS